MPITLNIFVSSTWLDLQPEREAVERTLQKLRTTKFVGMEYFGSRDEDTRRASLSEVDRCQIYVGIFGGPLRLRYYRGRISPGAKFKTALALFYLLQGRSNHFSGRAGNGLREVYKIGRS